MIAAPAELAVDPMGTTAPVIPPNGDGLGAGRQEDQREIEQGREADRQIEAHPENSVPPATIAVINHLSLDDMLEVDALVKLVTGGLQPDVFDRPVQRRQTSGK